MSFRLAKGDHATLSKRLKTFNDVQLQKMSIQYSKKLDNLKHAIALFAWSFNFNRKHGAHGFTPAFAAGVAPKEPMTIAELLSYQD